MFVEVYPLVRMPRRFSFFDYKIPESLTVEAGDLIEMSFRRRQILGVVRRTKESTEVLRTIPIKSVIIKQFMTADDVERFETIASAVIQSPSTILYSAFGQLKNRNQSPPKNTFNHQPLGISKSIVTDIKRALEKIDTEQSLYLQTSNEGAFALASVLRKKYKNQILIIAPREKLVTELMNLADLGNNVQMIHGHTPPAQREAIIKGWANGNVKTLVGSRQVAILPAQKIDAIIILESSSDDYTHLERNPRIDPRRAAELLARQHAAKIIYTSPSPSLEIIHKSTPLIIHDSIKPSVVNLQAQEENIGVPFLTDQLFKAIYTSLQNRKSVLLSFNRKGVANRLQCAICDHIPTCGSCGSVPIVRNDDLVCKGCGVEMWIPKKCPGCGSDKLKQKGIGNKRLKAEIQKQFPEATVGIVDKELSEDKSDILIVTEYYFKNLHNTFAPKWFGVIAELSFDNALVGTDFRSSEYAVFKLNRLISIAEQQKAECLIQTWMPEIVREMLNIEKYLGSELEMRKKYSLPPASTFATITNKKEQTEDIGVLTTDNIEDLFTKPDEETIFVDTPSYESLRRTEKSE